MMVIRTLLAILLLVISIPITVLAIDPEDINRKVADLNNQSLKSLGVSLRALLSLIDSENSYYPLWSLEESVDLGDVL